MTYAPPPIPSGTPYPPAPPGTPPPGWPVPPTRKRRLPGWAVATIVVSAAVVLLLAAGAVFIVVRNRAPRPYASVTSCSKNITNVTTEMGYIVRNNDTVPHDYTVHGVIGRTPTEPGFLVDVEPGVTATGRMVGPDLGDCRITSIEQR